MRDLKANLDMKWYEVDAGTDPQNYETKVAFDGNDFEDEELDTVELMEQYSRKSRLTD